MTFEKADFGALEALWRRYYPPRFAVDAELIRQNSVDSPVFDWGASRILAPDGPVLGFVLIKKSASSLYKGPDPDMAHISAIAFDDPIHGVDLLAETKRNLRNRGIYKLVFGQDSRHFFPGCPDDFPALQNFLEVEGFEKTSACFDLERDMDSYEVPAGFLKPRDGVELRVLGDSDRAALDNFLTREFPGRWHYDTFSKIEAEGRLDFIMGLFVDGELEGFALTQDFSNKRIMNGAVWRQDLGEKFGGLGPIGVSASVRGRGLGHAILGFGLRDLKKRGVQRAIIDWTGLDKFYGAHGFEVTRRYTGYALRLDA